MDMVIQAFLFIPLSQFQQILFLGGPRLLKSQTALKDNSIFPPSGDTAKDMAGVQVFLCASQKDVEEKAVRVTPTGVSGAPAGDGSWWEPRASSGSLISLFHL